MKKIFSLLGLSLTGLLLTATPILAFCPVCTVAAAGAVGLSRWLGVDDTISGLWLGALTVSMIAWTINWLKSKKISKWYYNILIGIMYYIFILIPFWRTDIISFHPANMLWGMDKILLGLILGSVFFLLAHSTYLLMKEKNGGHAHFPFEKIALPVGTLVVISIIFYYITR